jgi:Na+/proline symporter
MKRVPYWRKAHKRHSVRAMIAGAVVSAVGAAWASLPDALVDRLPMWVVLCVPTAIFVLGLIGAYMHQSSLEE